jgi:hypothetical protein
MKKLSFTVMAATGLMAQTVAVSPQGQPVQASGFQQAGVMGTVQPDMPGGRGGRGGGIGAVVAGSPVSAKEVRKTVQTLSDGTQLDNTSTTLFYRDSQGRTRIEPQDGSPIRIVDPVGGFTLQLNPATRTALRIQTPAGAGGARGGNMMPMPATGGGGSRDEVQVQQKLQDSQKLQAAVGALNDNLRATMGELKLKEAAAKRPEPKIEDLGFQSHNGVQAQGTRSTMTIPQWQIGNNRDIHVVNERWYSKDLQMVVKTTNSDPRFGVTTFELTDIVQASPDVTLFQVPAGYTVNEVVGQGRGGR